MIMMSMVTEKPLSWELSWHLIEEARRSQINFDCTVPGGWGSHVGVLAGYQCDYLTKLEPSLCTNGQTKVVVMVAAVVVAVVVGVINSLPPPPPPSFRLLEWLSWRRWATRSLSCKLWFCDLACTFIFHFPKIRN